jgi:hypothetical protein
VMRIEGQTGADRAGLDFAIEKGLEHRGYVPKGLMAQDFVEYSPAIRPNKYHPRTRSGETCCSYGALRIRFKSKSGINSTSLRASLHLFRFGLDLEDAPHKRSHCILRLIAVRSCLAPID